PAARIRTMKRLRMLYSMTCSIMSVFLLTPKGLHPTAQGRAAHPGEKHPPFFTAKRLYPAAQGRAAHPGENRPPTQPTLKGLHRRDDTPLYNPYRVETPSWVPLSQGALRDPGLWDATPSG